MGSPFYKDARAHLKTLLEGSQHLYKTVHPPISQSVHRSVCHTYVHQIRAKGSQEESLVITSSCNHFINMMTHRQPYGPRFIFLSTFVIIFHRLTKNMASFRDGRMLSQPPRSFIALSSSLLPPHFLLHFNNTKDQSTVHFIHKLKTSLFHQLMKALWSNGATDGRTRPLIAMQGHI